MIGRSERRSRLPRSLGGSSRRILHLFFAILLPTMATFCARRTPVPAPSQTASPKKDKVRLGRDLYVSQGCTFCHGREGLGDGSGTPDSVLQPANLTDPASYKQGRSTSDIARTLELGIPGGAAAMPTYSYLTLEQREAIAAYLISIIDTGSQ